MSQAVLSFLATHKIPYVLHEHPAVFTCEEAEKHSGDIPGLACKNLFLKGKRSGQYFLVIMPAGKRMDLKQLGERAGDALSFASEERLMEKLGLTPGAVTPFGLLNDREHEVKVFLDPAVDQADIVSFHPNVNTATVELGKEAFHRCLELMGNAVRLC